MKRRSVVAADAAAHRRRGGTHSLLTVLASVILMLIAGVLSPSRAMAGPDAPTAAWTPTRAAMPPDASPSPTPYFLSVSCGSAGSCAAVGDYYDASAQEHWLLETLSNGTWTATEPPMPANAMSDPDAYFLAVSCAGDGSCVALGRYRNSSNSIQGLVETLSGGSWTVAEMPVPANAITGVPVDFSSVSCPTAQFCAVVGSYYANTDYGRTEGLIETLSGGSWTATEAALPDGAESTSTLAHVSCPTPKYCVAVGGYDNANYQSVGLSETFNGSSWAPTGVSAPASANGVSSVSLSSVSCAARGSCTAIGSYSTVSNGGGQLIATLANGVWSSQNAPIPPAAHLPQLWSVACGQAGSCVVVGSYEDANTNRVHGLIDTLTNGTWTATTASLPGGVASTDFSDLSSVWCSTAGSCIAVGEYGQYGDQAGLVDVLANGHWTATEAPLPADASANPPANLVKVGCSPDGSCVAAGLYTDVDRNYQGVLESGAIPAPPSLTIGTTVVDAPMPVDPATTANVKIVATVTDNGTPVPGATVQAVGPSPIRITATTGGDGQADLLYPVSTAERSTEITGTLGNETTHVELDDVYSSDFVGECHFDGSPNKLNALNSVLPFLLPEAVVPAFIEHFAEFIHAIDAGGQFIPSRTETNLYGFQITGPGFKTIYALKVTTANAKTGSVLDSTVAYSHQRGLIAITVGEGGGVPLQRIENRFSCGVPA